MKIPGIAIVTAATVVFAAGTAMAQNSKVGAAVTNLTKIEATTQTFSWDPVLTVDVQVAQQTDLTLDLAVQCGLFTDTTVKSGGNVKDTSSAFAQVALRIAVQALDKDGNPVGPVDYADPNGQGGVVYCSRTQTLSARLQGILDIICTTDPVTGVTDCDLTVIDDEEIQLVLDTLSANAFNFVVTDLVSGDYRLIAEAEVTTNTDSQKGSANATGLVGMGSLVVDEVRFVKGSDPNQ